MNDSATKHFNDGLRKAISVLAIAERYERSARKSRMFSRTKPSAVEISLQGCIAKISDLIDLKRE